MRDAGESLVGGSDGDFLSFATEVHLETLQHVCRRQLWI